MIEPDVDENVIYQIRKQKLAELRGAGFNFPNQFHRQHISADLLAQYQNLTKGELVDAAVKVVLAGRIILRRIMGKASFFHLQDVGGRIQVYLRENDCLELYEQFKHWDLGDIVGVSGVLFKTNTGELTVHVENLELLSKSLRPLPDKYHGLTNQELRYRKRYLDLIMNEETRQVFVMRSRLIKMLRQFMDDHHFAEVETPMMHPIPGGAQARPFVTHHHTLDRIMYLRIAPELYLKRLIVGGLERVYEINRNFRNEGLSTRHNPEFTMIEFYQAYANYHDLMKFTEQLLRYLSHTLLGVQQLTYQGNIIDFAAPFARMSVCDAIMLYNPNIHHEQLESISECRGILDNLGCTYQIQDGLGKLQMSVFDELVEQKLIQPTFITQYPTEVSPLARCSDTNAAVTDRFELFIAGRELANGFSELNDPEIQADRFRQQMQDKNSGNDEAMHFDGEYIEALEYGMPPTAGEGIGIDRLVMLFTNAASIRDVIFFPQMRAEAVCQNKS